MKHVLWSKYHPEKKGDKQEILFWDDEENKVFRQTLKIETVRSKKK